MSVIQEELLAYLDAQVPDAGKGYPLEVPQGADFPAWSYQIVDDDQLLSHGGGTNFYKCRIQIDLIAPETEERSAYANAAYLAAQLRLKLDGYRGLMGSVEVHYCKTMLSDDWAELHKLPVASFDVMINYKL